MRDVIIVGAGPAGLSAALILGRCLRRVLICDTGKPRNAASQALHGFFTRDGTPPLEMLRLGRQQLRTYDTIELRDITVSEATRLDEGFEVVLEDGTRERSRMLLIASGVVDKLPEIEGLDRFYGRSIFHCPYCDAWEVRGTALAVYGRTRGGVELALKLKTWSPDVVLCTDGRARIRPRDLERLTTEGIAVHRERVARLEGTEGQLERIVFRDGSSIERHALFLSTGQRQHCPLPQTLGCEFTRTGAVRTGKYEVTRVPGLYVAGDASRDLQLAIVAAAEGAQAAFAINTALTNRKLP
jgi:thioredoxin reductase